MEITTNADLACAYNQVVASAYPGWKQRITLREQLETIHNAPTNIVEYYRAHQTLEGITPLNLSAEILSTLENILVQGIEYAQRTFTEQQFLDDRASRPRNLHQPSRPSQRWKPKRFEK